MPAQEIYTKLCSCTYDVKISDCYPVSSTTLNRPSPGSMRGMDDLTEPDSDPEAEFIHQSLDCSPLPKSSVHCDDSTYPPLPAAIESLQHLPSLYLSQLPLFLQLKVLKNSLLHLLHQWLPPKHSHLTMLLLFTSLHANGRNSLGNAQMIGGWST